MDAGGRAACCFASRGRGFDSPSSTVIRSDVLGRGRRRCLSPEALIVPGRWGSGPFRPLPACAMSGRGRMALTPTGSRRPSRHEDHLPDRRSADRPRPPMRRHVPSPPAGRSRAGRSPTPDPRSRSFHRPQRLPGPPHAQTRQAIDGAVRHTPGPFHHLVQQIPVAAKGIEVGVRPRGRAAQRLLRHHPAARAKQARDPAEGPHRVGLVHQEKPRISQVERAARRCRAKLVDVTGKHLPSCIPTRRKAERAISWVVSARPSSRRRSSSLPSRM